MSLKLITAPAIEPVTVDEIKLNARISHDVEDDIISTWISSARNIAENFQARAFISQIWEVGFDYFPCLPLFLPRPPLLQLISIKYYDSLNIENTLYYDGTNPVTTTEEGGNEPSTNADFIVDTDDEPGRLGHAYNKTWPSVVLRPMNSVKIRYAAGYGLDAANVPPTVRDAIMLYCTWRNENRTAEAGAAPQQFFDLLRQDRMKIS